MEVIFREYKDSDYEQCEELVNKVWGFDKIFSPKSRSDSAPQISTGGVGQTLTKKRYGLYALNCAVTSSYKGRIPPKYFGNSNPIQQMLPELEMAGNGLTSEIKASSLLVFKAFRKSV